MKYQRCTRCVMDNASDKNIVFDESGYCNYCIDTISRMSSEYFPNQKGRQKLDGIMAKIKSEGSGKEFDCLVGVSGGVDSSYIIYLGYLYGLRMLAVHIDDGLDTDVAKKNIADLCERASVKLINIKPDKEQYADLLLAFIKASLPNLAMPQDNILSKELYEITRYYNIKYSLIGANFAHESILERSFNINACDSRHIKYIHKHFGTKSMSKLKIQSLFENYLKRKYFSSVVKITPLNYLDYNLEQALKELQLFSNYTYYGGKHYESILTRFLQCYYLPVKYGFDKRKSHFSSLIVSGQMTRSEAIEKLSQSAYLSQEMLENDMTFLADFVGISKNEFEALINLPPKLHSDYPCSVLNKLAPVARYFRKYLG